MSFARRLDVFHEPGQHGARPQGSFTCAFAASRMDSRHRRQQPAPCRAQIRKRAQLRKQSRDHRQPAITHFRDSELALDHLEGCSDIRADPGLKAFNLVEQLAAEYLFYRSGPRGSVHRIIPSPARAGSGDADIP